MLPHDESLIHRRALCERWWVLYLAQGYFGSALKVFWHPPFLLELLQSMVETGN